MEKLLVKSFSTLLRRSPRRLALRVLDVFMQFVSEGSEIGCMNTSENLGTAAGISIGSQYESLVRPYLVWTQDLGESQEFTHDDKEFILAIMVEQMCDDLAHNREVPGFTEPPHRYAAMQRRVAKRMAKLREQHGNQLLP